MRLTCGHCGHEWNYKGKQKHYCTCPRCLYKVSLKEKKLAVA